MNKKTRKLLILIGIFLMLLLILFGIRTWNQKQAEEVEPKKIYVTDLEEVSKISYNIGNGELTFEKQNDTWVYVQDEDFPLKQSVPERIVDTFGKLEAERELKEGDEAEAYGLDAPVYSVELTDKEGKGTVLNFGNAVNDNYYLNVKGKDVVYTVSASVLDELQYTMDELAQFDIYPEIGSGNLVKETITKKGKTTTYDSTKEEDAENIAAVAGGLGAVTLDSAADYSVTDENLPEYGLDEKTRITVKATYTEGDMEQELILYIGSESGDGNRYVMINDSRIVYLISDAVCDNILNVSE